MLYCENLGFCIRFVYWHINYGNMPFISTKLCILCLPNHDVKCYWIFAMMVIFENDKPNVNFSLFWCMRHGINRVVGFISVLSTLTVLPSSWRCNHVCVQAIRYVLGLSYLIFNNIFNIHVLNHIFTDLDWLLLCLSDVLFCMLEKVVVDRLCVSLWCEVCLLVC